MTTHYQKIQALGTKMAENLTTMGVPSQFSEGGLTLADKILEIRSMSDGIFLFGRDDIIQTGGTARFSGICLDDSKLVRDTVELFSCDEGSFSNPLTSNTTGFTLLNDSEEITTSANGTIVSVTYPNALRYTPVLYLSTQSITVRFKCKTYDEYGVAFSGGLMTSTGNMDEYTTLDLGDDYLAFMQETFSLPSATDLDNWTDVKIEYTPSQQKLYINGTLVATATQDFTDNWYHDYFGISGAQIKNFSLTLDETVHATGSGALTYDYTGVGIGRRSFALRSGSYQSEPFALWDTIYHNENTITEGTTFDVNINSNSIVFEFDVTPTANNSQCWFRIGTDTNNCLVVGLISTGTHGIMVRKNGSYVAQQMVSTTIPIGQTTNIKITYSNGVITYSDNDETVTLSNNEISTSKLLTLTISNSSVTNIKVYNY